LQKYSGFPKQQISLYLSPSRPDRGALAIVTNAGRDAVDAGGATDESTDLADGEDVWSCSPALFSLAKERKKRLETKGFGDIG
jgi:hypothetical protein